MDESTKGKIKFVKGGSLLDWCGAKGWTIRAFANIVQLMCDDEQALGRCLDKARVSLFRLDMELFGY